MLPPLDTEYWCQDPQSVAASTPIPWPGESAKETWEIQEESGGGEKRIWISNEGITLWNPHE
eukprot:11137031-Prorocentrum_lima.AAC.1